MDFNQSSTSQTANNYQENFYQLPFLFPSYVKYSLLWRLSILKILILVFIGVKPNFATGKLIILVSIKLVFISVTYRLYLNNQILLLWTANMKRVLEHHLAFSQTVKSDALSQERNFAIAQKEFRKRNSPLVTLLKTPQRSQVSANKNSVLVSSELSALHFLIKNTL